jgi:phage N-6-adenine-methyltransferase
VSCRDKAQRKRDASKNTAAVTQSLTNEWYTPALYIESARAVLGGFDLDPASCEEANQAVQAAQFYSEADPGLDHEWKGRVWLNPPYGRLAGDFIVHLDQQYRAGLVTAAIALVNAHCTDTAWFRPLWDHTLCFTYGRLNFAAGTARRGGSTHGSVFAYLGPDPAAFAAEFAQHGAVVQRWH